MGVLDVLNPPIFNDSDENRDKKKKRSLIDDVKTAKNVFDKTKTVLNVVRAATTTGPVGWIVGAIVLILIFVIFFTDTGSIGGLGGGGGGEEDSSTTTPGGPSVPAIPGFNITLTGPSPSEQPNGVDLTYTVTISHDPSVAPPIETIELYDSLPAGATFLETSGSARAEGNTHFWPLSETINQSPFTIKIRPNVTDAYFDYTVSARLIAGSGGTNTPPTTDNCNGKWDFTKWPDKNPLNANYGDPVCDFTQDDLYTLIQQTDPPNAEFWYMCAGMESTYHPNAYAGPDTGTPDAGGAWGLFQMGRGKNGPTDHGDVEWRLQLRNAVAHSKKTTSFKDYWQCARDLNYDGIK